MRRDDLLLDERVRFDRLFQIYAPVLTDKQRTVCELMLRDDLSGAELAEELGVTRQGVHDIVRRTREQLERIEDGLGLARLLAEREAAADLTERYREELPEAFLREAEEIGLIKKGKTDV